MSHAYFRGENPQIWLFHVVVLLTTAKKWTKMKNARTEDAKLLFFPPKYANMLRFFAVAVVVANAPYYQQIRGQWNRFRKCKLAPALDDR